MFDAKDEVDGVIGYFECIDFRFEVEGAEAAVFGPLLEEFGVEVEDGSAFFIEQS